MKAYSDLKSLTKKELLEELRKAQSKSQELSIMVKTGHHKDTSHVAKMRKYVARLHTALKEIEFEESIEKVNKID